MNEKTKKLLWGVFAIILAAVAGFWLLTDDLQHIDDTNGPDDHSLAVITDENMIKLDIGSLNLEKSTGILNDGITFSSEQFSGVYQLFVTNYIAPSDLLMDVTGFSVNSGNFKMAVINNDAIIAVIEPDLFAQCYLQDLTGTVSVVIAGESADFTFSLDKLFCEEYQITVN